MAMMKTGISALHSGRLRALGVSMALVAVVAGLPGSVASARAQQDQRVRAQQGPRDAQPQPEPADMLDNDAIAALLGQLPPEQLNGLIGAEVAVEVVGDQIFLTGPQDAVKTLELLIRALDETGEEKVLELVKVEKRDANEIASTIEPVLKELLFRPNQEPEDEVSVRALSPRLLIVSAIPGDLDFVVSIIEQVDEEEDGIVDFEQLIFPIKYRKAAEVATQLGEILQTINAKSGSTDDIQIIPNSANNSIMVIAPEEDRPRIQKLIDELDVEPVEGFSELKLTIFPLLHSKANDLAEVVTSLLAASESEADVKETILRLQISKALPTGGYEELPEIDLAKTTTITPDEGTNSLIVKAAPQNLAPLRALIELLDGVPSAKDMTVRLFPLRFADAESVSGTLQEMFDKGKDLPQDPDGSGEAGVPTDEMGAGLVYNIGLFADARTNTLIFAGRAEQLSVVQKVVAELDRPATAMKFPLTLIRLDHSDATRVGQILEELLTQRFDALESTNAGSAALERERVFMSVDIRSNGLIISASPENLQEIKAITAQLDTRPVRLFDQIRIIALTRLAATDLKTKIDELWARKGTLRGAEEMLEDLPIVVADERSNTLVVASSIEDFEEIKELVETLEQQPLMDAVKLFKLELADAAVMASMLDELFNGMAGQLDTFQVPTIIPDPRSNSLVVAATRDSMERAEDLIARLDVEAGPMTAVFQVYSLEHGSATKLAPRMQELFDSRSEDTQLSRTPIVIMADESSNSVICSASRDDQDVVVDLLKLLDRPSSIAKQFRIFPLKMAKATQIAEKLDTLFASQQEGSSGRADAMAVEADERTNSIIVWAAPSSMDNIGQMIAELDTSRPAVEMMVRIIQLKQALAEDFASLLTEGLLGDSAGADDERAVILSWTETLPDGRRAVRKLLRQDIQVQADPRTNSLMVVAPTSSMAKLEAMIRDFDTIRPIQSEIRLFQLINGDAEAMVTQIMDIFEANTGEGDTVRQLNFGDAIASTEFARVGQDLRLTADARTNTIIAAGAEVDLQMVEDLIRYLDAQEAEDRVVEVVPAKFRDAQDIANAVQGFISQEQDATGLADDEESAQRRMDQQVSIEAVGDPEEGSSSLIVGTSRRKYGETMEMINELDRPEPQVMISVLIAEVALRDDVELGVEVAGQDLNFSESAVVGPNGLVMGDQFDYVLGTSLGAAPTGLGGINFTVSGQDFSFLLHALQQNSRLETLSRPILMVRNGEEGNITIADQIPFVESSRLNDTGQTQSTIGSEDVGIVMTATPNISPDGYVTIALRQELSNFSGQNLQLTEGVSSPVFSTREVQTNITVRDGETVIIGGLITSSDDESENKVPILGDLPYIGFLFRTTAVTRTKTELIVVLTVDILRTDEDVRDMSIEQRDKFIMSDRIRESPLMEGLRITPDEALMGGREPAGVQDGALTPPGRTKTAPPSGRRYGPKPKTYGPVMPRRPATSASAGPVFGPRLAKSVLQTSD
ncbi:MAG: secretin N-terminal domain-containing protein [Phycisphaerae bacterium]